MKRTDAAEKMADEYLSKIGKPLDGIDMLFARDQLMEYAWTTLKVRGLRDEIDREGVMKEVEKGGANNRHIEKVENPACASYRQLAMTQTRQAKSISAFIRQDKGSNDEDELAMFNMEC